jgi:hypothetical protein
MLPTLYFFKYIYCFHNFKNNNFPAPRMARCGGKCGAKKIAYNVPAVYDVFAARIKALRSKDQGCKNVGGVSRGKERGD